MTNIRKFARFVVLLAVTSACLFADTTSKSTIDKVINVFARLDVEYRVVQANIDTPGTLKRYELELQKAAEEFFKIANAEQQRNPELSKAAGITGRLIVDSAYIIYAGLERKDSAQNIFAVHCKKIAFLPSIYLGMILPLAPSNNHPSGFLTQEELKMLQSTIAEKFGGKIAGPKTINGDNAFTQTASLTDGFLKALSK